MVLGVVLVLVVMVVVVLGGIGAGLATVVEVGTAAKILCRSSNIF